MNKTFNKIIKSHLLLSVLTVIAVILVSGTVTYALFQVENKNSANQVISIGNLDASLTSTSGAITITDIYPKNVTDLEENENTYSFTVTNTGDYTISYELYLTDNTSSVSASYPNYKVLSSSYYQYIDYRLNGGEVSNLGSIYNSSTGRMTLIQGKIKPQESKDYTIQFWLDNGDTTSGAPNDINGSVLALNINLDGTGVPTIYTSEDTLAALDLTAKSGTPDFNTIATTDETANGLYAMADDYGTSYYFRGAVTNNYVRFAGFYWRIIRINGDGSIRMIYDGTQAYTNGTSDSARYVTTRNFNSSKNNNAYVGYMYGSTSGITYAEVHANTNSSTIKTYLEDTWYKTNIVDAGYSQYISDEIFCNDRSLDTTNSSYTGIGTTTTYYGAYQRLKRNTTPTPQLTCPQKNDAFTVSDTEKGNGALKYPVGLITADEIVLAGGKSLTNNSSYYLYKGNFYWLLSPYFYNGDAYVFGVNNTGYLGAYFVSDGMGVAPVINLNAEYSQQLKGSGTTSSPFTVS